VTGSAQPCRSEVGAARDVALARRIAAAHGLPAEPIAELTGRGSVNHVFVAGRPGGRWVIRFAVDPLRGDEFAVENWCLRLAAAAGVASPVPLADGVLDGVRYGIQGFVEHLGRDAVGTRDLWETLGSLARRINELPLGADAPAGLFSRFGRDLAAAWRAHLSYHLAELTRQDRLLALGVYPLAEQPRLREVVLALAETPMTFGLSHGDLAARNVLVRPDGALVLLDWGSASCGPVPYTDLLTLHRHHDQDAVPSASDLEAFGHGYGLGPVEFEPTLAAMRSLSALDLARWAAERRPDRLPEVADWARHELARPHR